MVSGGTKRILTFLYEVEAIEIALVVNAYGWMRYFSSDPAIMHDLELYKGMVHIVPASNWYTGALVLMVLQTIAFVSRSYAMRSIAFIVEIAACVFAQYALASVPIVTLVRYQNLGMLIAVFYGLFRLAIRRTSIRIQ